MLHERDLDLVSVLVESGRHMDVALQILEWKVPVLIEKPLTLSTRDASELCDAYEKSGVPLFIVKQNRLNPPVVKLLQMVKERAFGQLTFASASVLWCRTPDYYLQDAWRLSRGLDGGVVWNQASHYVDLLVQVLGEIESVFAYGKNFLSPAETEDTVFALLKSKNNVIGSLQATTTIRPKNFEGSITVAGESGLIRIGGHALNKLEANTFDDSLVQKMGQDSYENLDNVYGSSHTLLYEELISDIKGERTSQFHAKNSISVVSVMEAIHLSISEKREVRLEELL
jgi:predicted dehydrogenase